MGIRRISDREDEERVWFHTPSVNRRLVMDPSPDRTATRIAVRPYPKPLTIAVHTISEDYDMDSGYAVTLTGPVITARGKMHRVNHGSIQFLDSLSHNRISDLPAFVAERLLGEAAMKEKTRSLVRSLLKDTK